jgi:hypothetical protein
MRVEVSLGRRLDSLGHSLEKFLSLDQRLVLLDVNQHGDPTTPSGEQHRTACAPDLVDDLGGTGFEVRDLFDVL